MHKDVVLISQKKEIVDAVTTALKGNSPIVIPNFHDLSEIIEDNEIRTIVLDVTNDDKEAIEDALLIIANHNYTPILLIVDEHFGRKLMVEKINEMYWCISPCGLETLAWKLEQLKTATTTITRNLNLINTIMNSAPLGIAVIRNNDPKKSLFNPKMEELVGWNKQEFIEKGSLHFTHPNDLKADKEIEAKLDKDPKKYTLEITKRFIRKDGSVSWVELYISMIEYINRDNFSALVLAKDVAEEKAVKLALEETNRSKEVFLNNMPGVAYRCKYDAFWTMEYMSAGVLAITGYSEKDFINNRILSFNDVIVHKYRKGIREKWEVASKNRTGFEAQYEIVMKNKKKKWVLERGECVYGEDGEVVALEGVIFDIDEIKRLEKVLKFKSEFDEMTKLPNLQNLVVRCAEGKLKNKKTIVTINLNEIARLTTIFGYNYMLDFRNKIVNKLRDIDLGRGMLYLTQETQLTFVFDFILNDKEVHELYEKIVIRLEGTLRREFIKCGIGVYLSEDKADTVELAISRALLASEHALNSDSLINVRYYDTKIEEGIKRENTIFKELQKIIDNIDQESLYLNYQPIYVASTRKIIAFEALARFNSKTYGLVPPLEFIPIAEKNRISIVLGRRIIYMALTFLKRMHKAGYPEARITINISVNQLVDWYFVIDLDRFVHEIDVDASKVTLEITEQIYEGNYEKINKVVNELRKRGVRVAMDDFGTGFSSLGLLEKLNITTIKIDREFVKGLDYSNKDRSIVQDIVKMANRLGMVTIAEGVETEEQLNILKEFNCHMLQGYYLARPTDEEAAFNLLIND